MLTQNVQKHDFFHFLEVQRTEQLLTEAISQSSVPNIGNRYYSQLLMAQRLHRAELEVKLSRHAIEEDGLHLLEGMYICVMNTPQYST